MEGVTLSSSEKETTVISVEEKSILNIKGCVIKGGEYEFEDTTFNFGYKTYEIEIKSDANGVTLNMEDSEIYARYGIKIRSQGNIVEIENSKITGWSALDIADVNATELCQNNKVTVTKSTLLGVGIFAGTTNDYGTVIIGGQDGLVLNIIDSTIENKIQQDNPVSLICSDKDYKVNENVTVTITDSKLINNDTEYGSRVFDYQSADNMDPDNKNIIILSGTTTIDSEEEYIYI